MNTNITIFSGIRSNKVYEREYGGAKTPKSHWNLGSDKVGDVEVEIT